MTPDLPWHAVLALAVGYVVLAAWVVLLGVIVGISLVGRWLARHRIKRAVRELVGSGTWRYPARSQW